MHGISISYRNCFYFYCVECMHVFVLECKQYISVSECENRFHFIKFTWQRARTRRAAQTSHNKNLLKSNAHLFSRTNWNHKQAAAIKFQSFTDKHNQQDLVINVFFLLSVRIKKAIHSKCTLYSIFFVTFFWLTLFLGALILFSQVSNVHEWLLNSIYCAVLGQNQISLVYCGLADS